MEKQQEELSETITELSHEEDYAKDIVAKAESEKVKIINEAREEAQKILAKAAKTAEAEREKILAKKQEKIDAECGKILAKADAEAGTIKKKSVKAVPHKLVNALLERYHVRA